MLEEPVVLEKFFVLDISDIPPAYSPRVHSRIFLSSFYVGGEPRACLFNWEIFPLRLFRCVRKWFHCKTYFIYALKGWLPKEVKRQLNSPGRSWPSFYKGSYDDAVGSTKIKPSLRLDKARNELSRPNWSEFVTLLRRGIFLDVLSSNEGTILALFSFYHSVLLAWCYYFCFPVNFQFDWRLCDFFELK